MWILLPTISHLRDGVGQLKTPSEMEVCYEQSPVLSWGNVSGKEMPVLVLEKCLGLTWRQACTKQRWISVVTRAAGLGMGN